MWLSWVFGPLKSSRFSGFKIKVPKTYIDALYIRVIYHQN